MDVKSIEASIEVSGLSLLAIVEGFKAFKSVAMKYMEKNGLTTAKKGTIDTDSWYQLSAFIKSYNSIAQEVGLNVLFDIGESIPKNAKFPDTIVDIDTALRSNDVAYHMNHRKNGVVMFNPATGVMLEGIGHYGYSRQPGERKIVSVCDNPYPCRFDHGIITAVAKRFEPRATVNHDSKKSCRSRGGPDCTYIVTW